MLVATRLRVPPGEDEAFRTAAEDLLTLLGSLTGFVRGHLGRAPDEPDLWVLMTEWSGVGDYRRALSAYDVKMAAPAVMAHAIPEPSAYEVLARVPGSDAESGDRAGDQTGVLGVDVDR